MWLDKSDPSFVATSVYGAKAILLSGNQALLKTFMSDIRRLPEDMYNVKVDIAICNALKYLIIGDNDQAVIELGSSYQKAKSFTKGLGYVIAGILKNDIKLINEGIKFEISNHKVKNKSSIFYSIAEEATAWAKLASLFGLMPDMNSNFLCTGLTSNQNNFQYHGIDELYKALDIQPFNLQE